MKITQKKARLIVVASCMLLLCMTLLGVFVFNRMPKDIITKTPTENLEVTSDEMSDYRQKIGTNMDVKRSIIILFNTKDEAQSFINENGNKDVLSLGKGIVPMMEEKNGVRYYNVVGNGIFEPIFDSLQDGQYIKEPVEFAGTWCYFKRLSVYSVVNDDNELKELIKREKSLENGR